MKKSRLFLLSCFFWSLSCFSLPNNFVYLKNIDASILQEMRYAGDHNFIGRPISSYRVATCILTKEAALALTKVQQKLRKQNLTLKVYDCYRPTDAVKDFVRWSTISQDQKMKAEFYPRVDKRLLFKLGYIAKRSGHSRGSTVDLTIVNNSALQQETFTTNDKLRACYAPWSKRFRDNSIDMGSGFDCLDQVAHFDNKEVNKQAQQNRLLLQQTMTEYGFEPYDKEWWHFTLKNEPYKNTYFNFPVQ